MDLAISVIRGAGAWLLESGKNPSKWWQLQNLTPEFLLQYAKPEEFYVVLVNKKPAAAAILQRSQTLKIGKISINQNQNLQSIFIGFVLRVNSQAKAFQKSWLILLQRKPLKTIFLFFGQTQMQKLRSLEKFTRI